MAADFEVTGADTFLAFSRALKNAGRNDLRRELNAGIRDAVKPLIPKTRAAARSALPTAGGLAERVARAPQRVQVRTGQETAGARLAVGGSGSGARGANTGRVRHPVFGQPGTWVSQTVPDGWFDETLEQNYRSVIPEVEAAMERVAEKIAREVP